MVNTGCNHKYQWHLSNGTVISHVCASKMHDKCGSDQPGSLNAGCKCACGCNVGKPEINMARPRRSSPCTQGNHNSCYKRSGGACPCYCHDSTTQSSPSKVPDVMPVSRNTNYKHAAVRLNTIADVIKKEIFLNEDTSFYFYGDTVLDALFGGIVDKYSIVVENNSNWNNLLIKLVQRHVDNYKVGDDKYIINSPFGDIEFVYTYSFGNDKKEVPTEWTSDTLTYNKNTGFSGNSTLLDGKTLSLNTNPKIADPAETLKRGVEIAQKYGLTIATESINSLGKLIELNKPLENTHELVVGFRCFNLMSGHAYTLRGQHEEWDSETKSVDCVNYKEHVSNVDSDWRSRGARNYIGSSAASDGMHDCGIYVYKDPSEALFHYGKDQGAISMVYCWGVIGEFEKGYRVEHCEIQRLWIWKENIRLSDAYKIPEIISGAQFSDFLYDPEVVQFASRFTKKAE